VAFCTFPPTVDLAEDRPALDAGLAQPLLERPDRAGAFGQWHMLEMAATRDLDFPSCPSWSVFDLGSMMVIPRAWGWRCSKRIPASSDRRSCRASLESVLAQVWCNSDCSR